MDPKKAKTIVIKLGTSSVMHNNRINTALLNDIAKDISELVRDGKNVIIVSSGAIGLGLERMHLNGPSHSIDMQQAMAAIGQSQLMNGYENAFAKFNQVIAQVLLTQRDLEEKICLQNLRNTLAKLLALNIVPVLNENDAVATDELAFTAHFSDNDLLATKLALHTNADLLIMVSHVGGLFTQNPESNDSAELIEKVNSIKDLGVVVNGKSRNGKGGFATKLEAAELAMKHKVPLIVTSGKKGFIKRILNGEIEGTLFEG